MRRSRAILITAAAAAFCLVSSTSWAQQIGNQDSGPLDSLIQYLRFDPFLVAAIVIALTLVIGMGLDVLRRRFPGSERKETPESN